jgi:hypothetical protein
MTGMRWYPAHAIVGPLCAALLACSSSGADGTSGDDAGAVDADHTDAIVADARDTSAPSDTASPSDAPIEGSTDANADAAPAADDLSSNRDRLLGTYYAYLKSSVTTPQSNGLSGSNVTSLCDLWVKLQPSAQAVYLTITHRMQGSRLRVDGASMLSHVTKLYRLAGGDGATATSPGSCGGSGNRMIMSMDAVLHDAQLAANQHKGAKQSDGKYDIGDVVTSSSWRDSHDLGGSHAPFDLSDETEGGAPRGQTQYFQDPTSSLAQSPLGKEDLATLVDPYALEMDQDYDCVHNSNPSCDYVTYGAACFPKPSKSGVDIYTESYGSFDPTWKPKGCGP